MLRINGKKPNEAQLEQVLLSRDLFLGVTPFTSALVKNGKIVFYNHHLDRLKVSFSYLYPKENWESVEEALKKLKKILPKSGEYYLRLTMIRIEEGVALLSHWSLFEKQEKEILLKSAKHPKRVSILPNFLKNGNYLESFKLVEKAREEGFTDCLFLDEEGRATESSVSNIFFRKGNRFFSPPLKGPVLDGITRKIIYEILEDEGLNFEELAPSRGEWETMDEVYLTNALNGIQNVKKIDSREFETDTEHFRKINEKYSEKIK